MKRVVVPELLDFDSGTPEEVAGSLADLRMINRRFGGVRTMTALLKEVAGQRRLKALHWLDVAGGAGDVVAMAEEELDRAGVLAHTVILDRAATHLKGTHLNVCGDALALPFRNDSFDVVGSSLFAHHLDPEEIVRFAKEGLRVARHAFVIHDLVRHPLHVGAALAGRLIYRSRITRHDGPVSVRRAYRVDEMRSILEHAGASQISIRTFYFFRMGVIAWKGPNPSTT